MPTFACSGDGGRMVKSKSLLRRFLGRVRRALLEHADYQLAWLWRRLMVRTTVIAITGSTGKTTAKELLLQILRTQGRTMGTRHNENDQFGVPRTMLRMRPWHRFAVVEVGTGGPGDIRRSARLLRPDVALVLSVGGTHADKFPTLEHTAAEKASLLEGLSRCGLAVLNADDARVAAMAARAPYRVETFGTSADCTVHAESAGSRWPQRLCFELHTPDGSRAVTTQLVGEHWLCSVLGAVAVAAGCRVPLDLIVAAIGTTPPFMGRMQPVALHSGAVMVRDEENGSAATLPAMIKVLTESQAQRRGLIFSDMSDTRTKPRKRLRDMGRLAAQHCDFAVFIGDHAHHARKAALDGGLAPESCVEFVDLRDAAAWLGERLREGDLVFLKGRVTDHLSRILFAQFGEIGCWKTHCRIHRLCDVCPQLRPGFELSAALARPIRLPGPAAGARGGSHGAERPAS